MFIIQNPLLFLKSRFSVINWIVIYCIVFHIVYKYFLNDIFDYFGYHLLDRSFFLTLYYYFVAVLPSFYIPVKLTKPSMFIIWLLYLMTYITSQLTLCFCYGNDLQVMPLSFVLLIGMTILILSSRMRNYKIVKPKIEKKLFFNSILILNAILLCYVLFVFKGNLHFSSVDDVYEQRFLGSDLMQGNMSGYAIFFLSGCLLPLLMAQGLVARKYIYFLIGFAGQIIIYTAVGSKTSIFSSLIFVIFYLLIKKKKNRDYFGSKLTFFLIFLSTLLLSCQFFLPDDLKLLAFFPASMFFMRTQSMGGLLTSQYFEFFSNHSFTYYSHIRVLRGILSYPYGDKELGQVVGYYFYSDDKMNANAHFWMTDGYAAAGIYGVVLISIIAAIVFYVIDCLAVEIDVCLTSLMVLFPVLQLLNISLFTVLFSGGLMFVMLILYLYPKDGLSE
jgi:oligosaccharide repeat unit polymerase